MHEVSIIEDLFDRLDDLAREHGADRIESITLDVGEFCNVVPELLESAFVACRPFRARVTEATLIIRPVPLEVACDDCLSRYRPDGYRFTCAHCGSPRVRVVQGEEFLLRDVGLVCDMAEPEPAIQGDGALR